MRDLDCSAAQKQYGLGDRQAEAIKWVCISQNFKDRRARAAHSDWVSLTK